MNSQEDSQSPMENSHMENSHMENSPDVSPVESIASIASIKSDESYCHNQGDTNWCAAYTSAKLLARLLTNDSNGYKKLGKCFVDHFTQHLDRKSSFPYEYLYQFVNEINSRIFVFDDTDCNKLYNRHIANYKFKIVKSETRHDISQAFNLKPNIPKILSIHGTKDFYDILESYKIDENPIKLQKYNDTPISGSQKFGHSLYVKKYDKTTKKLIIKDTDGFGSFRIPLNLLLPSIKFVITIKKINKNALTAKGIKKTKRVIRKTRKIKT